MYSERDQPYSRDVISNSSEGGGEALALAEYSGGKSSP